MEIEMRKAANRLILGAVVLMLFFAVLLLPGLPWSARCRYLLKRVSSKAEMRVSAWQGLPPKLLSISGKIVTKEQTLKGAEVEALDSVSGWAGTTDEQGRFVLPDVIWYSGARYVLVITANDYQARQLQVNAPEGYPEDGVLDLGELRFDRGCKLDGTNVLGMNSMSFIEYDNRNADYYKRVFSELTTGKQTDEEKVLAINQHIAKRLLSDNPAGNPESQRYINYESPRQILESGSPYCGKLAVLLATVAKAGNYNVRVINVVDAMIRPSAHMVTEVYYGDRWHLYDPTIAVPLRNQQGNVASYQELRLEANSISPRSVPDHLPMIHSSDENWLRKVYSSGFHHYYFFKK
jgi:hypothetical protein